MARKKRYRRKRQMTVPLAPVVGLAAGIAEPIMWAVGGDYQSAIKIITRRYTGYDPYAKSFNPSYLMEGLAPLVVGGLVHKFVGGSPINLNKTLASAGVPFIRI